MSDPTNLGAARADRTGDCRDWSPVDALRETIREIEAGEIDIEMLYIGMSCHGTRDGEDHEGKRHFRFRAAGGDRIQIRGLIATCLVNPDL